MTDIVSYKESIFTLNRSLGFEQSGENLVETINSTNPDKVIDAGCGVNPFKGKIKNLIGIDVHPHPNADIVSSIKNMNIDPNSVDVVLLLGTLQIVSKDYIFDNLKKVVSWVKPGGVIIVRVHPFLDYVGHNEEKLENWDILHRWTYSYFYEFTEKLSLDVYKPIVLDVNQYQPDVERLTWWWVKK